MKVSLAIVLRAVFWSTCLLSALCVALVAASPAWAELTPQDLRLVGQFSSPVHVAAPPGGGGLLFVVEHRGVIRVVRRGRVLRRPFADLRRHVLFRGVRPEDDQRGLLSIAFAPDYANSRRLYAFYVDRRDHVVVDELRRARESAVRAVVASRRRILSVDAEFGPYHHGGQLAFGPDGYLYISVGTGGEPSRAQDSGDLRGKILRIDPRPHGTRPYRIPRDNPFLGHENARPEIWALGLRNPWRFSFDQVTDDLLVGDVGDSEREEVSLVHPGANLGWPAVEGSLTRTPAPTGMVAPVIEHTHATGWCAIVGGFVIRDRRLRRLHGRYMYGDTCLGRLWIAQPRRRWRKRPTNIAIPYLVSFGEDIRGRLYVVSLQGSVWRIVGD